ncbi:unnamed protein product [Medioppia subpectinata]|uniref:Ribosomal protein L32 n=1 Tax=Medioppia subpectinata TaxID=1979941 RepID=A0A7R9KGZ1_9ACAR|nr:unnamed protein product [Medioppia subpectinata]CAG2102021.1 unnamed protein product [Medioppia subpectinata]
MANNADNEVKSGNVSDVINAHIFAFNRFNSLVLLNIEKQLSKRDDNIGNESLIEDIMRNGFVFATQKKRRTVERRLERRFGLDKYPDTSPIIRAKQNLIPCDRCGQYHEFHTICANCYKRVKEESNLIIEEMKKRLHYSEPIEEEVTIRYKNDSKSEAEMTGRRVVEMDRQRPEWFADNLLSKSVGNKWIESNPIVREDDPKIITKD